jgi:hypothetical protein
MLKSIANDTWLEFFKAVTFNKPYNEKESYSKANKSICSNLPGR